MGPSQQSTSSNSAPFGQSQSPPAVSRGLGAFGDYGGVFGGGAFGGIGAPIGGASTQSTASNAVGAGFSSSTFGSGDAAARSSDIQQQQQSDGQFLENLDNLFGEIMGGNEQQQQ